MKKLRIIYLLVCVLLTGYNICNAQHSISFKVTDKITNEPLSNVKIFVNPGNIQGATDINGSLIIQNFVVQNVTINISRIGYKEMNESAILKNSSENYFEFRMEQSEIMSGEINIYSTKIENQLKYAILPVAVYTKKDFDFLPVISSADIMKTKPGINLVRDGIWANDINIRGLSRDNIVVFINGNRVETANNHAARFALIDESSIERIEIIKGGVSSIYGSGATGGIVNIKTETGKFVNKLSLNGNVSGEYFSNNKLAGTGLSLFLNSKNFYSNIYAVYREATDAQSPAGVISNSSFRDYGITFNAGVKISKTNFLKIELQKYKSPYAGIPGGYPLFPTNATVTYIPADRDLISANYEIKDISNVVKNLTAHIFLQNIFRDVEVLPNSSVYFSASGTNPAKRIYNISIYPVGKHYTKGLLLQSDLQKGNSKMVAGIDIWQRELTTSREREQQIYTYDSLNNLISSVNLITGDVPIPDSKYNSTGIYVNDETSFSNDKIYLNLGGRIDFINISNEQSVNPLYTITNGVVNNNPAGQKVLWSASEKKEVSWSFNGGANYKMYDKLNVAGNISASFRSPSLEERYQYIDLGNLVRVGNPDLNPELGYFLSASAKYWGNDINYSLELYSNFLSDLVTEIPGTYEGRAALIKTNIDEARIAGFESELEYNFYNNIVLYGGISFVNGENTETNSALPQMPPLNGKLGLKYSFENLISANINFVIFNSQNRVSSGELATPGYTIFNFYLNFKNIKTGLLNISVAAGIENIFNVKYRDFLSTARGSFIYEPGRNIFLKTKINF